MTNQRPSLPLLERHVAQRKRQEALDLAIQILTAIDQRYGRLELVDLGEFTSDGSDEDVALIFSSRFANALGDLITDPEVVISPADFERLLMHHRWIDLIFSLSGFRTADHLIPLLAKIQDNRITFEGVSFLRLLVLRTMNSRIPVNFDEYVRANSVGSLLSFLHYISSRYVFWPRSFDFRERLLEWIPGRLDLVKLGGMTLARLPEIYMHCSYAITPKKHAIKADLMKQMRRACLEVGCKEVPAKLPESIPKRPTIIVAAEHFLQGHAVHRTHSRAIASLRERFHVVGVIYPNPIGTPIADFFDECIAMPNADFMAMIRHLADEIAARKPVLIFYLGVGMVPQTIALASIRLAPIQCVSFGHTATTMSEAMDYFILPEDFAGAPETFSEKVLAVPKEAMPFAPRPFNGVPKPPPDGTIRVAVPASTMKLNPKLFEALSRIVKGAKTKTEIQLFPLAGTGLPYIELARVVKAWMPSAVVFAESPHDVYIERLSKCDLFLCPFPYGNMNSIIDSFRLGMPGVCLDGAESHSHADTAFFARIGMPAELSAKTVDDYVAAAIRLIDDATWRASCQKLVASADLDGAFFRGDASLFCDAIADLIWPKNAKTSRGA